MRLYLMPGACSLASHIALIWTEAPFTIEVLDETTVVGEAYARINPKAVVPALELDDGEILTESLAILTYLADAYPNAALGASPEHPFERARLDEALAELVSDVHGAWSPLMVPARYVMQKEHEPEAQAAALRQLDVHYQRLEKRMRGRTWMLFDRRTVADAYLYVMCSWQARTRTPLSAYPSLDQLKTRLDRDPGVQRALADERPQTLRVGADRASSSR